MAEENTMFLDSSRLADVIVQLESIFSKLNELLFESKLSKPVITVASNGRRKNVLGWCSTVKVWLGDGARCYYEINICAEFLNRDIIEICGTIIHEMVHLLNAENDILDCSRHGYYHNGKFKKAAEEHGLFVEKMGTYGYAATSLMPKTEQSIKSLGLDKFTLYRDPLYAQGNGQEDGQESGQANAKQSTRKYACPSCHTIIRATRSVNVHCVDCDFDFIAL